MDFIIGSYPYVEYDELNYCYNHEISYQRDLSRSIEYGEDYYKKYVDYDNNDISDRLNMFRIAFVRKYCKSVLDIGVGSGKFVRSFPGNVGGYDINLFAANWLKTNFLFNDISTDLGLFSGLTFWDSLEHIPLPSELLLALSSGQFVFVSIPIFDDVLLVKESRHYRPDEHYYYFSHVGMIHYMNSCGFCLLEYSNEESRIGRSSISSYAFRKSQ